MAISFKVVLTDMTIFTAKSGQDSEMMKIGYAAIIGNLQQKLTQITSLIPRIFPYAVATVSRGDTMPSVAPEDALVMVESLPERTAMSKVSRQRAIDNPKISGMTELGDPAGVVMAVWLSRNATVDQIANAVIHEIGHAKSALDEEMHDQNPNGILARDGGSPGRAFLASDVRWMAKHLPKNLVFNMRPFSAGSDR